LSVCALFQKDNIAMGVIHRDEDGNIFIYFYLGVDLITSYLDKLRDNEQAILDDRKLYSKKFASILELLLELDSPKLCSLLTNSTQLLESNYFY